VFKVLKKAGVVAAAAAGLIMLGAPAFASTASTQGWDHGHGHEGHGSSSYNGPGNQLGLVNTGDIDVLHNVSVPVCANNDDIAVGLVAVVADVLSPKGVSDSCNSVIATGDADN
jgi:hypothetical protein